MYKILKKYIFTFFFTFTDINISKVDFLLFKFPWSGRFSFKTIFSEKTFFSDKHIF